MEWMTPQHASEREPAAIHHSVLEEGEPRVLRARRREPARPRQERRDDALIEGERGEHDARHARAPGIAASAPRNSFTSVAKGSLSADGFPITTSVVRAGAASRVARYASRSRRRTRFFAAARRTWRLTANPTRRDRKSTRLNSSHRTISYAVFCLKKK